MHPHAGRLMREKDFRHARHITRAHHPPRSQHRTVHHAICCLVNGDVDVVHESMRTLRQNPFSWEGPACLFMRCCSGVLFYPGLVHACVGPSAKHVAEILDRPTVPRTGTVRWYHRPPDSSRCERGDVHTSDRSLQQRSSWHDCRHRDKQRAHPAPHLTQHPDRGPPNCGPPIC